MKRITSLIFLVLLGLSQFKANPTVRKHALIVAIGDYPEETNWKDISSVNDIALIKGALSKQGFDHFIILKNEEADKKGILQAFKQLKESVSANDIVVVHFSSHGQQIMDNNGDEIDGFDEAIVAYGAPAYFDPAYNGENHLRDEELGDELDELRIKLGVNGDLMVLVDACHSGTATRGEAVARGGVPAFAPEGYKAASADANEVGVFENSKASTRGNVEKAPMVVISAARANELNYEYNGYGSLSVAFQRAFDNLNPKYSYRSLFSKIVKEMSVIAPKQTPALEGDIDRLLFGGEVVSQEPYYNMTSLDGDFLTIEGGAFTGLNKGTTIKIYPAGTNQTKGLAPVATGKIIYSEAFECSANLDKAIDGTAKDYWVFADERTFGDVTVSFRTSGIENKKLRKLLADSLESFPLAKLDNEKAIFELKEKDGRLQMIRVQDAEIYRDTIRVDDGFAMLKEHISTYAQGKFLKDLELNNPDYSIELELIPVKVMGRKVVDTLDQKMMRDAGGMMQFMPGEKALIKITNNGSFPVYFNIIDIGPKGDVFPVMPNPNKNEDPRNFKIAAGQSYIVPRKILGFGEPYGTETFKIFASYEPINFAPILRTRGAADTRGVENQLEKLFQSSYTMSRGVEVETLKADTDACTFSYTFKVIERR